MAGCAICSKHELAVIDIPRDLCRIGGRIGSAENLFVSPARKDSTRDPINLLLSQHSPGALRERRHRCSSDTVDNNVAHSGFIDDGKVYGTGYSNRRSSAALRAVATRAVLRIESVEVQNLARGNRLRIA